ATSAYSRAVSPLPTSTPPGCPPYRRARSRRRRSSPHSSHAWVPAAESRPHPTPERYRWEAARSDHLCSFRHPILCTSYIACYCHIQFATYTDASRETPREGTQPWPIATSPEQHRAEPTAPRSHDTHAHRLR